MGIPDFDRKLANYADLAITVGLNLQQGQRLLITNVSSGGVVLEAARRFPDEPVPSPGVHRR